MAIINLRPEAGEELAAVVTNFLDKELCESEQALYDACRKMGDENHLVQEITEKHKRVESQYNGPFLDCINAYKRVLDQYTDWSTYSAKLQADSSTRDVEVGAINSGAFDAAHNL